MVADALSRLDADATMLCSDISEILNMDKSPCDDKNLNNTDYPMSTQLIAAYQRKDKTLMRHLECHPDYFSKTVDGTEVILFHKKIYVPKPLRHRVISWYHDMLVHPGAKRTELTIRQHLVWPGLTEHVENYVKSCHQCQRCKTPRKKYGHLPIKEMQDNPWDTVCVNLIGPYTIQTKEGKELSLQAMTMCDPATGWFEIHEVKSKAAEVTAVTFDQQWLCRYPRPKRVIFDNGNEFLGKDFQELLESYGIEAVPTTIKNPQANYVERVHQTLGNMLRTFELEDYSFDTGDPWSQILTNCA